MATKKKSEKTKTRRKAKAAYRSKIMTPDALLKAARMVWVDGEKQFKVAKKLKLSNSYLHKQLHDGLANGVILVGVSLGTKKAKRK